MAATRALRKDAGQGKGEGPKHSHIFREFGGINTQAARQAIGPGEFAWIENVQPIGYGNLRVVPAVSAVLASVTSGDIYYGKSFNIDGVNYGFVATDTGHAYQVLLTSPYTVTEITASLAPQFSGSGVRIAQWANERILIVDPENGYFTWDGAVLTEPGFVVAVTVTAGGSYTTIPTISFTGGGGTGAAAYATMTLDGAQTVTVAGTGYVVGDIITLSGGTYVTPGKLHVDTVGGGGAVTAVSIYDPGEYSVLPTAPAATTGGGNNDCTITPNYAVLNVVVTDGGTTPYSAAPNVVFSSGAATADAALLGGPPKGSFVASAFGQVYVAYKRTLQWSVPDSYYDFSSTGAGSKIITDDTLLSDITSLTSANNFLYYTGETSINVIGDATQDTGGETVFSDTNLTASVGTSSDMSVTAYYRSLWMSNRSGVYVVYGSSPQKASDPLDGIYELLDHSFVVSSAQFMLRNILCLAYLLNYQDPGSGNPRKILAIFFNKKWFVASQGDLDLIFSGVEGSNQSLFGVSGANIVELFSQETTIDWTFSTALWDMSDVAKGKQITKFGMEFTIPESSGTVVVSLDSRNSQPPYSQSDSYSVEVSSAIEWINNSDEVVDWTNDSSAVVEWLGSGYFLNMQDGSQFGKYVGMTASSSDVLGKINSTMLEYTFRESW